MITLPFGFLFIFGVLYFSFLGTDSSALINSHSIVIVIAGTLAILAISAPLRSILAMWRSLKDLRTVEQKNEVIAAAILNIAKNRKSTIANNLHPLINYAQSLWEQGLEIHIFEALLTQKLEDLAQRSEQPVTTLKNLAKYPPALGMTGTVIGMIALFSNLGEDNKASIGPNLALAMTATFYGLALANFLIMPLADRLHVRHLSRVKRNEMVFNSLILINRGEPVSIVANGINGNTDERKAA